MSYINIVKSISHYLTALQLTTETRVKIINSVTHKLSTKLNPTEQEIMDETNKALKEQDII